MKLEDSWFMSSAGSLCDTHLRLDLTAQQKEGLAKAWVLQTGRGIVERKTVFSRIPKEQIDPKKLSEPGVKDQVDRLGYFDVASVLPEEMQEAFEWFDKAGYISKKKDVIHNVFYYFDAFPYVPFLSPSGMVGIKVNTKTEIRNVTLNGEQFGRFMESAKLFKSRVKGGKHPHISRFEYGENYNYETDIFETRPEVYDTLWLSFDRSKQVLDVQLTEPFVVRTAETEKKDWKRIGSITEHDFLGDSDRVISVARDLPWKKKIVGILEVDDNCYYVPQPGSVEELRAELGGTRLAIPDFLGGGNFSYENYMARIFEDSVADYLRTEHSYEVKTRIRPKYLDGGELDVFAQRGLSPIEITCCECKLRFNDQALDLSDVESFQKKIGLVIENESRRSTAKFHFWLVTNAKSVEPNVPQSCKGFGIEVIQTTLSHNWQQRPDWKVESIQVLVG